MMLPAEIWESEQEMPEIEPDDFYEQLYGSLEHVHTETKRKILLHMRKFNRHSETQTEGDVVDHAAFERMGIENRRLEKAIENLNDKID